MTLDLTNLSIINAQSLLKKKEISSIELVEAHLKRLENYKHLNAIIEVTHDLAIKQAKDSDAKIANGSSGILEGIPIGIKDLFCTKGILTTACSKILEGFKPGYESTVTSKIYEAGGICIGKTNMDEFAMGSTTSLGCYGPTINPWKRKNNQDLQLVAGGSSGGSAAAVAAELCMAALGSDTGGSVRQPASFCGVVGIKPTYGRCSRYGMIAFSNSLDQAGVLARSTADAALVLEAICGYDIKDSTSANITVPSFIDSIGKSIKGLRIGIPKQYISGKIGQEISNDIRNMLDQGQRWLLDAGAEIKVIDLPHVEYALPVYYVVAPAEASSNLARYDGVRYGKRIVKERQQFKDMVANTRGQCFGDEVKRRILSGTYVLSAKAYGAYYLRAQKVRRLIYNDFQNAFKEVCAILTPITPTPAFVLGENEDNPVLMYLNDIFTTPVSLAGLPGISVPSGLDSTYGLPLGLQIIGKLYDEESVFKIAHVIEQSSNFKGL